jgi:hypothetical protein
VLGVLIISIPFLFPEFLMPGDLTENHSSLECDECHKPWEGAQDSKCIGCHEEPNIHWHNNSVIQESCQSCHKSHEEEPRKTDLNCSSCHTKPHGELSFSENDCLNCHVSPGKIELEYTHYNPDVEKIMEKDDHREGEDCYLCHDTKKFDEYNCLTEDCHGTNKYDKKHEEKAQEWKTTDCFEPDCHSKGNGRKDPNNTDENGLEVDNGNGQDELCLVFIIISAVVILILGYFYITRAMKQ